MISIFRPPGFGQFNIVMFFGFGYSTGNSILMGGTVNLAISRNRSLTSKRCTRTPISMASLFNRVIDTGPFMIIEIMNIVYHDFFGIFRVVEFVTATAVVILFAFLTRLFWRPI